MKLFFDAIANELNGISFSSTEVSDGDFAAFVDIAAIQKVLPIAGEALLISDEISLTNDKSVFLRGIITHLIATQTLHTAAFLSLYRELEKNNLRPCVVKGVVCARLYPQPDARLSGDFDLLISPCEAEKYADVLKRHGFETVNKDDKSFDSFEMTFARRDGLRLEVHKALFPPYGRTAKLNDVLGDVFSDCVELMTDGISVRTLSPTRHLLYLILHAFKHFVMSGFGIRQVCDIALFAKAYAKEIDAEFVAESLFSVRAAVFSSAVFGVAIARLGFSSNDFLPLISLLPQNVDPSPLAADIVSGGIYGGEKERQHAAAVTMNVFLSSYEEKMAGLRSVFPDRRYMADRYPYVKKSPLLLPAAWCRRIASYVLESARDGKKASGALEIGRRRTKLLKYYGIID